jgi:retron-type reverse transcriptase
MDTSHGFRTGRGCHTALDEIASTWTGTTWFIEGDIADCFGSLDHEVMLAILAERIHDKRFLRLVGDMLRAGYLEDWTWHATYSGAPQGSLCSAAHNPPNEQCWIMRSAGLSGLVRARSGLDR